MFERYTEKARRTIFFARYEASQFGCLYIETEHLLLGLFREDKELANRFLGSHAKLEAMRRSIEQRTQTGRKVATSVDLPLSHESKRVLAYAAEESEGMHHEHIGTPHILLGLLREEKCFAAELLRQQGLTLESVREYVHQSEPPRAQSVATSTAGLRQWIAEREGRGGVWIVEQKTAGRTEFAIFAGDPPVVSETATAQPPPRIPVLCVEVVRDERFSEVQERSSNYMAAGVAEVWILDPNTRRAFTVTLAEGLCEFQGDVLKFANPPLEMDLKSIFD